MGQYKKMLTEGVDLSKIVSKIKDDVLKFRQAQEKDEALFRKELGKVEGQAKKALADIAKVLDKHQLALEALYDERWNGAANERLKECVGAMNQLGATVKEVLSETEGEMEPAPEDEPADVAEPEIED